MQEVKWARCEVEESSGDCGRLEGVCPIFGEKSLLTWRTVTFQNTAKVGPHLLAFTGELKVWNFRLIFYLSVSK